MYVTGSAPGSTKKKARTGGASRRPGKHRCARAQDPKIFSEPVTYVTGIGRIEQVRLLGRHGLESRLSLREAR